MRPVAVGSPICSKSSIRPMRLPRFPTSDFRALNLVMMAAAIWPGLTNAGSIPAHSSMQNSTLPSAVQSNWCQLPPYPRDFGVAGILAGEHRGVLIAAGGANFPDRPPWEGGKKIYYDDIYVLLAGATEWTAAGRLPTPRGYSAVVSVPNGVLVVGGENADQVFSDSFLLSWDGQKIVISPAPALPVSVTNSVAVVLEGKVYLAGGNRAATPRISMGDFWRLDLAAMAAGWRQLPAWPGPTRAQAVMAVVADSVYLFSGLEIQVGADGKQHVAYLTDAYRYCLEGTWEKLPDMPWSAIAAPSPAPITTTPARIFVLGGVDGSQVGKLPRGARLPDRILCFEVADRTWKVVPGRWPDPVVTSPAVCWNGGWAVVSGEISAGVRTRNAWIWRFPDGLDSATLTVPSNP
jgi:N-acetylneuraminate epimerase